MSLFSFNFTTLYLDRGSLEAVILTFLIDFIKALTELSFFVEFDPFVLL